MTDSEHSLDYVHCLCKVFNVTLYYIIESCNYVLDMLAVNVQLIQ